MVGVNKYLESEPSPLAGGADAILTVSEDAERGQIERLKAWRAQRDNTAVAGGACKSSSAPPRAAAISCRPRSPAPKPGVTTGEWGWTLREAFGEYRAPTGVGRAMRNDVDRPRRYPRRRRPRVAQARPPADLPGRQARPRRPFQRRRADRRARARCRHAGGL